MSTTLYIQIPCTFENKLLTIKALRLEASGETPKQALLECIKNTAFYTGLKTSEIKEYTDFRGRDFIHIEAPFSNTIYDAISEFEPTPNDSIKRKQLKSFITEPTPEEVLKLGY